MDIDRLRYFTVVAAAGSLAKAAPMLKLSPPALSKAMAVLERELGRALFTKAGRGLELTPAARELLPRIEALLAAADGLRRPSADDGPLRIRLGTFEVFSTHVAPTLLAALPSDATVELHEMIPGEIEAALAESRIDLGITYLPIPRAGVAYLEAGNARMSLFASREAAAAWKDVPLSELPFVVPLSPLRSTPTRVRGLDGWPDDRVPRRETYRVALMESALALCREGRAVAWLPRFVVRRHNAALTRERCLVEMPQRPPRSGPQPVSLVFRQGRQEDRVVRGLARALRALCREGD